MAPQVGNVVTGLRLRTAPFLKARTTTPRVMFEVIIALLPPAVAAAWYFGLSAPLVLGSAVLGCVAAEALVRGRACLADGSAILTGLLLGLTLPATISLWMAFLGGVVAISLGKLAFGGLGHNLFNPALVGRAFLQAAFPTALTTWARPESGHLLRVQASNFAAPLMQAGVDAVTGATPLAVMKFEHHGTDLGALLLGNTGGSLGETSAGLIIIAGLFLLARRTFDWRIPVSILATVAALSGALYAVSPERYPSPLFMLLSGGLLFGTVYMATDPVTSPIAPRGAWIYGFGIGVLVVLIRLFGGLPEGVMYAILLMNAATPLIERYSQSKPFGRARVHKGAGP